MGQPTANQHRAGKKIAAQLAEHGVHESAYQVAKHLDAAKAWERGDITLAQLCERAGFDLPAEESVEESADEMLTCRRCGNEFWGNPNDTDSPDAPYDNYGDLCCNNCMDDQGRPDTGESTTYAYRIETYFPENGTWDLVKDEARGVETYDGPPEGLAQEILHNFRDDYIHGEGNPGTYRVLAWEGDQERNSEPDGWADTRVTEGQLIRPGGRPEVGPMISTRIDADLLARVDEKAESAGESRAATIRRLLGAGLGES